MDWADEGMIISFRKHGESSAILDVLTVEHGLHAGLVRGGGSRKMAATLQPGGQVRVEWRARLEEQLGSYRVEPLISRAGIMSDRMRLSALSSICAVVKFAFPERMVLPRLYKYTTNLVDQLNNGSDWISDYTHWEMTVLDDLGFGLDLSSCAATGSMDELIYVSPKSGRAVSKVGGAEWKDHLLPLPEYLMDDKNEPSNQDILDALRLTGFFLSSRLAPALNRKKIPDARTRFIERIAKKID